MRTGLPSVVLGDFGALVMGILFRYRALPFLKNDQILIGGHLVPTADFAAFMSRSFLTFGAILLLASLFGLRGIHSITKSLRASCI